VGRDVLVGLVLGEEDALPEQIEAAIRADIADDFYATLGWQTRRWPVAGRQCPAWPIVADLHRAGSAVGGIAVMDVVELDEGCVLGSEVREAAEHLGPEEALVPNVVEMLDDTVAPRLAERDEAGSHLEIEAHRDHRPEELEGRRYAASEVGVIVELGGRGQADFGPHRGERHGQQRWPCHLDDVVGCLVGADVDQVQGVELDATVQMTRSYEVDLMERPRFGPWCRVGNTFGDIARRPPPWPAEAGARQHTLDRASWRNRAHPEAAELPGDSERAVLCPRVGDQALTGTDDLIDYLRRSC